MWWFISMLLILCGIIKQFAFKCLLTFYGTFNVIAEVFYRPLGLAFASSGGCHHPPFLMPGARGIHQECVIFCISNRGFPRFQQEYAIGWLNALPGKHYFPAKLASTCTQTSSQLVKGIKTTPGYKWLQ